MATALAATFGFNLAAAGLLTTGIFLTHAGMQIPGGYLADRAGPKPVILAAAMGLVNMLGIVMILAAPLLIGQMVEWFGNFQSSFLALAGFTALAWLAMFVIDSNESDRSV